MTPTQAIPLTPPGEQESLNINKPARLTAATLPPVTVPKFRIVVYRDQFGNVEPGILSREYANGVADLSEISLAGSTSIARLGVPHGFGPRSWCEVTEEAPVVDVPAVDAVTTAQGKVAAAKAAFDVAVANFKEADTPAAATAVDEARASLTSAQADLDSARMVAQ
jgi:hypothetical protein